MAGDVTFLGREFLTWLWYASEQGDGRVTLRDDRQVVVALTQRMVLQSETGEVEGHTVKSSAPGLAEEARTALRVGKTVTAARLLLGVGDRAFEVGFDAASFALSGAKLPSVMSTQEAARIDDRLELLAELEGLLDGLFITFLSIRRDEAAWLAEHGKIAAWMARTGDDETEAPF